LYALILGVWIFAAAVVGVALAWAYSAPPFRLKRSGWWGPASVGFSYEGLSWFTGAAIIAGFQFPYLLALVGAGKQGVARDVGLVYLFNTLGGMRSSSTSQPSRIAAKKSPQRRCTACVTTSASRKTSSKIDLRSRLV